jgi:hypothetical protein
MGETREGERREGETRGRERKAPPERLPLVPDASARKRLPLGGTHSSLLRFPPSLEFVRGRKALRLLSSSAS